jgi:Rrf2 family protein
MITVPARQALRTLAVLARHGGPIDRAGLGAAVGLPAAVVSRVLQQLRLRDLVVSRPGRGGDHRLARAPAEISILDVLRACDGPVAPLPCLSATAYRRCADCANEATCPARRLLAPVNEAILDALGRTTLAEVLARRGPPRRRASRTPTSARRRKRTSTSPVGFSNRLHFRRPPP